MVLVLKRPRVLVLAVLVPTVLVLKGLKMLVLTVLVPKVLVWLTEPLWARQVFRRAWLRGPATRPALARARNRGRRRRRAGPRDPRLATASQAHRPAGH
jgi:hypothetical protein